MQFEKDESSSGATGETDTRRGGGVFSVVIENLAPFLCCALRGRRSGCLAFTGRRGVVGSDGALAQNPQAPVLPTDTFLVLKYATPPMQWPSIVVIGYVCVLCMCMCVCVCVDSELDC
jgi:hypothetical protein